MRKLLVIAAFGVLSAVALAARPGAEVPVVQAAATVPFAPTGAEQTYTVPAGVTKVFVEANGAAGASACFNPVGPFGQGGNGKRIQAILTVTPGQILFVEVGGVGSGVTGLGGFNGGGNGGAATLILPGSQGGGGGGASDVRTLTNTNPGTLASRVITAGGGGGAGGCGNGSAGPIPLGARSGGTYNPGAPFLAPAGGSNGFDGDRNIPGIGGVAGQTGGAAGTGTPAGTAGVTGVGGNGGAATSQTFTSGAGGGGGGGLVGGGGGGAGNFQNTGSGGGGGGSGSSGVAAGVQMVSTGFNGFAGSVLITPLDPPTITKAFLPTSVTVNGASTMTLTISNSNTITALSSLAVSDPLPAGIVIAATPGVTNTCGGTVTAPAGGTSVSLAGGSLPIAPGATCAITVNVVGITVGSWPNTTGTVTSAEAPPSGTANATLTVNAAATPVPPNTPTPIPTLAPPPIPVIPQVFQQIPLGIFEGPRKTPTPTVVVRAAVAPVAAEPVGVAPVLRPPSTGDAGLKADGGLSYAPLVTATGLIVLSAGLDWKLRAR